MFCVGRINIVKMTILPNAIYRFSAIPTKWPMAFFTKLKQNISEFIWKANDPKWPKQSWEEEWSWRNQPSWLQIILQSYGHQDSMVLAQKQNYTPIEQDRNPEINSCNYGYLIFEKGGMNIQWDKDSLFNKWCWENWTATSKRVKSEYSLMPYTKINSKWIKFLHVRPEIIKFLGENIARTLLT